MENDDLATLCDLENCTSVLSSSGASMASPIGMSLVGIIGNAIALATVHKTNVDQHRTVFFVFVAGLAWADLIGIIVTTIPVILVYSHGYYVGGAAMCNYHAFTMITFSLLTPLIVSAMALERLLGIRHAYFYMTHVNPTRARCLLLVLWLTAILFAALPFLGLGNYAIQYPGTWCFLNIHPTSLEDSVYALSLVVIDVTAIAIMIACNIIVQCTLVVRRCNGNFLGRGKRFRGTAGRNRKAREMEIQMMILLLAITFVFTLCWSPLQLVIVMNQFYEHRTVEEHRSELFAVRLASINQLLDPWVYILCKKLCFRKPCWKLCISGVAESLHRNKSQRLLLSSRQTSQNSSKRSTTRRFSNDFFHQINEIGKLNYDHRLESVKRLADRSWESSSNSLGSADSKPGPNLPQTEDTIKTDINFHQREETARRHSWSCAEPCCDKMADAAEPRTRTRTNVFNYNK